MTRVSKWHNKEWYIEEMYGFSNWKNEKFFCQLLKYESMIFIVYIEYDLLDAIASPDWGYESE